MYQSLLEMEKNLDWTMTRKRVEVQDALARNPTVCPASRVVLPPFVHRVLRRRLERSEFLSVTRPLVSRGKSVKVMGKETR